jgi:hypothetical protein
VKTLLNKETFKIKNVQVELNMFNEWRQSVQNCTQIVIFFKNHHLHKSLFENIQIESGISFKKLCLPGETRWGSVGKMLSAISISYELLYSYVSKLGFTDSHELTAGQKRKRKEIHDLVKKPDFINTVQTLIGVLAPIDIAITKFQSDKVSLSDAFDALDSLKDKYVVSNNINIIQVTTIKQIIDEYWNFIYEDATGVAYYLDPKYCGARMSQDKEDKTVKFISDYKLYCDAVLTEEQIEENRKYTEKVNDELVSFQEYFAIKRVERADDLNYWNNFKDPRKYWTINGPKNYPYLFKLAIRVFNFPASTASSERTFSTLNFIHSKLRNRLQNDKVNKLIYIKENAKVMKTYQSKYKDDDVIFSYGDSDSDSEHELEDNSNEEHNFHDYA